MTSAAAPRGEPLEPESGQASKLFARHMESMTRLALLVSAHLKPQATRLLYDANFLSSDNGAGEEALRDACTDLVASSQELNTWAARLTRFAERGVDDREPLALSELFSAAETLARGAQRGPTSRLEINSENSGAIAWTSYVLAVPLLAEILVCLARDDPEALISVSFFVKPSGTKVGLCLSQPVRIHRNGLYPEGQRPFGPLGELSYWARGVEPLVAKELNIGINQGETAEQSRVELIFPGNPKGLGSSS